MLQLLRRLSRVLLVATLGLYFGAAQPAQAHEKSYTKAELRALKKEMKKWSKALGVKCKFCHNIKNFKEWTPNRRVGHAMKWVMATKLKPLTPGQSVTCADCHQKSLKPDPEALKSFGHANLSALAPDFEKAAKAAPEDRAKDILNEVAKSLRALE